LKGFVAPHYFIQVKTIQRYVWWILYTLLCISLKAQPHHSVVITEIMADPSPSVGLPSYEWIEIRNNSKDPVQLQNWRIADGSSASGAFPACVLLPDSLLIVASNTALPTLRTYGNAIGVSSFPFLDNTGEVILLRNSTGQTIHAVGYETSWYGNNWKSEGGWTLEMVNPQFPCWGKENWKASMDLKGGSPGKINSINDPLWKDDSRLLALHSYARDSSSLTVVFNKSLDSSSAVQFSNYRFTDPAPTVKSIYAEPPLFNKVVLKTVESLQKDKLLLLLAENIRDCHGNRSSDPIKIKTGWASLPKKGDWILNEILFNPRSSGNDFVECYNNSRRILDLSQLLITNRQSNGELSLPIPLSKEPILVFPDEYKVFTEDEAAIQREYLVADARTVIRINDLPSMPDTDGNLVLLDLHGNLIDELKYDEDWHFPLLEIKEGVSLERLRANSPTQEKNNWHSAASTEGFATPGRKNSQQQDSIALTANYQLHPRVFSPDMDGKDDLCTISYQAIAPGQVASVTIYNEEGRLVRTLVPRATLAHTGYWNWEGLDDKARACSPGIYIIVIQQFGLDGKKRMVRLPVVLARSF